MTRWMLDTNTVSVAGRGRSPSVDAKLRGNFGANALCVSVITEGEILFGLARKPAATKLADAMRSMFSQLTVLAWTSETAQSYGRLRETLRTNGYALTPLNTLIAAHALSIEATLVTSDRAFRYVPGLAIEDWND